MSKNPIKTAIAALALAAAATASAGTIVDEVGTPDPLTSHEIYALKAPISLSERATSVAAQTWLKTGYAPSMLGTNGQVMYAYGQSQPTITCAPLHICVINLLLGEHITNLSIGDSVRWMVQTADAGHTPVVVIKPVAAGLTTNLVVTTDAGRVYYMTLVSRPHRYVPQIGFYDPQQIVIRMQRQADAQVAQDEQVDHADVQRRAGDCGLALAVGVHHLPVGAQQAGRVARLEPGLRRRAGSALRERDRRLERVDLVARERVGRSDLVDDRCGGRRGRGGDGKRGERRLDGVLAHLGSPLYGRGVRTPRRRRASR